MKTLESQRLPRNALIVVAAAAVAALAVVKIDAIMAVLAVLWKLVSPLLFGAGLAYFVNLVMRKLEKSLFSRTTSPLAAKLRRPVCMVLSLALIVGFVALVVTLVASELGSAFKALGAGITTALQTSQDWLSEEATAMLDPFLGSQQSLMDSVSAAVKEMGGLDGVVSTALSVGKGVSGTVVDAIVALVFALYLLAGKENVLAGAYTLTYRLFPEKTAEYLIHAARVADESFSRFIMGQCLEGCILGCLCALGMKILGMPYAAAVGLCVGTTSLVPLVGAWVGGAVGALMILSVDPMQAVWFVVFLVVLQQIEGHLIYPNVVGTSVGVPGIWVLVSVFIGGSLFGILGVFLGVPVVAVIRRLVKESLFNDASEPLPQETQA